MYFPGTLGTVILRGVYQKCNCALFIVINKTFGTLLKIGENAPLKAKVLLFNNQLGLSQNMLPHSTDETLPTLLKTEEGKPQEPIVKIDPEAVLAEEDEEAWYVCKNCRQRLTRPSDRMIMQGSHMHTFANPSGVVFEIACFASARGYSFLGPPSTDFTWFSGYSWRIIVCSACISHLGWFFSSQSENRFFGLITDRIFLLPNNPT